MGTITGTDAANTLTGTAQNDDIFALGGDDTIILTSGTDTVNGGEGIDLLRGTLSTTAYLPGGSPVTYMITENRIVSSQDGIDTTFSGIERLQLSNSGSAFYPSIIDASKASGLGLTISGGANTQVIGSVGDDFISIVARNGVASAVDASDGNDRVQVNLELGSFFAIDDGNGIAILDYNTGKILTKISNAEEYVIAPILYPNNSLSFTGLEVSHNLQILASGQYNFVMGGSGDDRIIISGPESNLRGQSGADTFLVSNMTQGGRLTIADFSTEDVLSIGQQNGIVQKFIGKSAFSGVAGEYRYSLSNFETIIEIDRNGDRQTDVTIDFFGSWFLPQETSPGSNILTKSALPGLLVGIDYETPLIGTDQNDFLFSDDSEIITGGKGNDILVASQSNHTLSGGQGADAFVFVGDGDYDDRNRILDFGNDDILILTSQLQDNNGDGIITFGSNRVLDLENGSTVAISLNGKAVRSLEYDGFYDMGDERFYIYSKVNSAAGVDTFANMSLAEYLI